MLGMGLGSMKDVAHCSIKRISVKQQSTCYSICSLNRFQIDQRSVYIVCVHYISLTYFLKASSSQYCQTCYIYTLMIFTISPVRQPISFQIDVNTFNNNIFLWLVYNVFIIISLPQVIDNNMNKFIRIFNQMYVHVFHDLPNQCFRQS